MLTQLLPEQVSRHWPTIRYATEQALPPMVNGNVDRMENILTALLVGKMQCWVSHEDGRIGAIILTSINKDDCSGTRSLLLYAMYGYELLSGKQWVEGFEALSRWGKAQGVDRLVAYTESPKVLRIVERLGGNTEQRFVTLPLKEVVS